ncbi:MAG: hypothetical protein ACKVT2_09660 [Saprospiraceae bacterium]
MHKFSWKNFALIFGLTLLVGIGEYALAYQFNDGKISAKVIGSVFLGMALPSLLIGGVMRLFKPRMQRYFAITAGICLMIGLIFILT